MRKVFSLSQCFLFLVCLVFHTSYSNAEIIYSLPSNSTRIEFSVLNLFSAGPVTENGITWTSTLDKSVYGCNGSYGLNTNGDWNPPLTYMGLNRDSGTMTIEFARLASSVFGLINYAPSAGYGKIAIYDSTHTLIETRDLSITTPSGNNQGQLIGFKSSS